MRILHIIGSIDARGGGPVTAVLQQAEHRPAELFSTHIATLDAPEAACVAALPVPTFAFGPSAARVAGWRRKLPWVRYGHAPKLAAWLKANLAHYDVVVVDGLWNYAAMAARKVLVDGGTPYVVFPHGMLDPWFRKAYPIKSLAKQALWLFNEGPLLNNACAVMFTTQTERESSRNAFWPYRVRERVASLGCDDIFGDAAEQEAAFRGKLPALGERRYLLFLSRIHPKKGCDILIEAFAVIASDHAGLDLVIAGPDQTGWKAELLSQAKRLGVADRIHWPGMLVGDVKWGAYRGCEAFVLPSHQENFGIVVAEALAAGKPALISDKVQIWREVFAGGGSLTAPDTAEGFATLLKTFLRLNEAERLAMEKAARATFLARFEMSRAVAAINRALLEVIDDRSS